MELLKTWPTALLWEPRRAPKMLRRRKIRPRRPTLRPRQMHKRSTRKSEVSSWENPKIKRNLMGVSTMNWGFNMFSGENKLYPLVIKHGNGSVSYFPDSLSHEKNVQKCRAWSILVHFGPFFCVWRPDGTSRISTTHHPVWWWRIPTLGLEDGEDGWVEPRGMAIQSWWKTKHSHKSLRQMWNISYITRIHFTSSNPIIVIQLYHK